MNRYALFLVSALAAALGGCKPDPGKSVPRWPVHPPGTTVAKPSPTAVANGHKGPPEGFILMVRVTIVTIEVPVGTVSGSERLWSYLNEELLDPRRLATLGRNGLRIGAGRRSSWPDVLRLLTKMTGRAMKQSGLMLPPGSIMPCVVKQHQPIQTIFTFRDDGTCSGADYPPGENLLTFACTFDPDQPKNIMLTGIPQIRSQHNQPRVVQRAGGATIIEKPTIFTFDELTFQLKLAGGDFVVIGPGAQAARRDSVAHHFLIKKRGGIQYETILALVPEVVAAATGTRRPGPLDQPAPAPAKNSTP